MRSSSHVPVMLEEVVGAIAPRDGAVIVDGTFGAGGYTRAFLDAAQCQVHAIDRDPEAIRRGQEMVTAYAGRLTLHHGPFGAMADHLMAMGVSAVDGIALDIGVSSDQIDVAERGFSFQADGPLDMRMGHEGLSAADVVNTYGEAAIARILFLFGEERRSRALARAIVAARPLHRTLQLAGVCARVLGRGHDGIHPATRTFQALRIYVNDELGELARALEGAERLLKVKGRLAVVSFHSLEDRIVKVFLAARSGLGPRPSRHLPSVGPDRTPSFRLLVKGTQAASASEIARNPRARSAKLRAAERLDAPATPFDPVSLGLLEEVAP